MKSVAKAEAWMRDLKEKLEFRGFSPVESKDTNGWPELTIGTDAYIKIYAIDAVSKDVFGNDLIAFTPHEIELAAIDAIALASLSKIQIEIAKLGIKELFKSGADLAAAKAATATAIEPDVKNPKKGM